MNQIIIDWRHEFLLFSYHKQVVNICDPLKANTFGQHFVSKHNSKLNLNIILQKVFYKYSQKPDYGLMLSESEVQNSNLIELNFLKCLYK